MMELNLAFKSLNGPRKNATCHKLNIVLFDSCISFRWIKVKGFNCLHFATSNILKITHINIRRRPTKQSVWLGIVNIEIVTTGCFDNRPFSVILWRLLSQLYSSMISAKILKALALVSFRNAFALQCLTRSSIIGILESSWLSSFQSNIERRC